MKFHSHFSLKRLGLLKKRTNEHFEDDVLT